MSSSRTQTGTWHSNRPAKKGGAMSKGKRGGSTADGEGTDGEHGARALWRGSISFGLVQIPVTLATAERANELSFHQLDRHDRSPIGYDRVNKTTGKKVAWGDIVKGYEIERGQFVIVDDEDFKKANVEATQTIDIQDFVDASEIPPAFFERPYHLLPDGKTPKAYAVLGEAMAKKNLVAIALVVIRTRQHLCAILPRDGRLELELLRFAHDLREAPSVSVSATATPKEVRLAEQLIDSMVAAWEPEKYKDTYRDDLLAAIQAKAKTGVVSPRNVPTSRGPAPTNLLSLLQRSVQAKGRAGTASHTRVAAKRAPSRRKVA